MDQQPERKPSDQEEPDPLPNLPEAWVRFLNAIQKELEHLSETKK